jgi:hypothetical protein
MSLLTIRVSPKSHRPTNKLAKADAATTSPQRTGPKSWVTMRSATSDSKAPAIRPMSLVEAL